MMSFKTILIIVVFTVIIKEGLSYYKRAETLKVETKSPIVQEERYFQSEEFKAEQMAYNEKRREGLIKLQEKFAEDQRTKDQLASAYREKLDGQVERRNRLKEQVLKTKNRRVR